VKSLAFGLSVKQVITNCLGCNPVLAYINFSGCYLLCCRCVVRKNIIEVLGMNVMHRSLYRLTISMLVSIQIYFFCPYVFTVTYDFLLKTSFKLLKKWRDMLLSPISSNTKQIQTRRQCVKPRHFVNSMETFRQLSYVCACVCMVRFVCDIMIY
jgi:hypothetical protein